MLSGGEADSEEIIITKPNNMQNWIDQLSPTDRDRLNKAIGYDANENVEHAREVDYCLSQPSHSVPVLLYVLQKICFILQLSVP